MENYGEIHQTFHNPYKEANVLLFSECGPIHTSEEILLLET